MRAGQVISGVIRTFQVEVPLRYLFEAPTVAAMAVAVAQDRLKEVDLLGIGRMLQELESLPEA